MKNEVFHLWERCCAASPTNVILFVDDHPTSLSASSIGQVVCESTIIIQLRSVMLDEKRSISLWERCCAASPTNVILFVDDHPTSLSASTIIIQLLSCLLDKNEVLHLWEGCCAAHKCNTFRRRSSDEFVGLVCRSIGCESTIIFQLRSVALDKKPSITFVGGMLCITCKYEKDPIKNS